MASAMQKSVSDARDWAERVEMQAEAAAPSGESVLARAFGTSEENISRMNMVRTVRLIGGAMVTILLIAVVLNEVFAAVSVGDGPFSEIGTDLETTGVAAVSLLVVGLIVLAANRLMNIFGSGM